MKCSFLQRFVIFVLSSKAIENGGGTRRPCFGLLSATEVSVAGPSPHKNLKKHILKGPKW